MSFVPLCKYYHIHIFQQQKNQSNLLLFVGRRSRRNSFSDDSQLTIENFGGSQDQLNMIGRAFEREKSFTNFVIEPAVPVRSSMADARGSISLGYNDDDMITAEKSVTATEKQQPIPMRRKSQTSDLHSKDLADGESAGLSTNTSPQPAKPSNTTTWQQQSVNYQKLDHSGKLR